MVILMFLLYLATLVDVGDHVVGDHVVGDHVVGDYVVGDHVVGDHVVGDEYLHDSVMFTKSVMLQPRSMASQTMKAAESPNTTYKVADVFFVRLIEHQQNEYFQKRIAKCLGLVTVECIEASVYGSA